MKSDKYRGRSSNPRPADARSPWRNYFRRKRTTRTETLKELFFLNVATGIVACCIYKRVYNISKNICLSKYCADRAITQTISSTDANFYYDADSHIRFYSESSIRLETPNVYPEIELNNHSRNGQ